MHGLNRLLHGEGSYKVVLSGPTDSEKLASLYHIHEAVMCGMGTDKDIIHNIESHQRGFKTKINGEVAYYMAWMMEQDFL